jgi:chloramphenicol-sensitive protein RarD
MSPGGPSPPRHDPSRPNSHPTAAGVAFGAAAYLLWGTFPIYFKALRQVPAIEVLAHRVVWSFVFSLALVAIARRWQQLARIARKPRTTTLLACSTVFIATNWLFFIYAVEHDRILDASLGYFMNPLVNVLLGYLFLGERLRRVQLASLALAAAGVLVLVVRRGELPWISLVLALSFGGYGLVRKVVAVDPITGLFAETALLTPVALGYLVVLGCRGQSAFASGSLANDVLLPLSGPVTALPLLLFAAAARRLRLGTLGFLQFLSPSAQFVLAVAVYHETFTWTQLSTFLCIWAGLALFSLDAARQNRRAVMLAGRA